MPATVLHGGTDSKHDRPRRDAARQLPDRDIANTFGPRPINTTIANLRVPVLFFLAGPAQSDRVAA